MRVKYKSESCSKHTDILTDAAVVIIDKYMLCMHQVMQVKTAVLISAPSLGVYYFLSLTLSVKGKG